MHLINYVTGTIQKLQLCSLESNSDSPRNGSWKPPKSATMTAVIDKENLKLLSIDANSRIIATSEPWTYTGATGPSMESIVAWSSPRVQ